MASVPACRARQVSGSGFCDSAFLLSSLPPKPLREHDPQSERVPGFQNRPGGLSSRWAGALPTLLPGRRGGGASSPRPPPAGLPQSKRGRRGHHIGVPERRPRSAGPQRAHSARSPSAPTSGQHATDGWPAEPGAVWTGRGGPRPPPSRRLRPGDPLSGPACHPGLRRPGLCVFGAFWPFRRKAAMSLDDIKMSSTDFLEQADLDSGGFGKVCLCLHRSHGLVILKKVYTGPKRTEYNEALLEEGRMMHRLRHHRVVKLLGVIMEEGSYSLVMEYMEQGDLMRVLKAQVSIPLSVKGRIIMETIEGMRYLHGEGVIHKDLKPENILVDSDFHIKIADLGVASFKTWSKLTKEEHNEQRKAGGSAGKSGGTLHYMAPEHLNDVNSRPSEKSDVFSFAIVLWAIFANKEPYENAICEQQLILCIKSGNRPDVEDIIEFCPREVIDIMRQCWEGNPDNRPTFAGIEEKFRPFYSNQLEDYVEEDVKSLKKEFPGQNEIVKRMKSLQIDCVAIAPSRSNSATEQPSSLHSSQGFGMGPVEESWFAPAPDHQPEENDFLLHSKLQEEANYHLYGSRMDRRTKEQPRPNMAYSSEEERKRRVSHDPFAQQRPYENAQSPGIKGLAYPGVMSHTSAAQQPAGLSSQPQSPYWRNGSFHPLGVRPLDLGTMSPRVWYGPNPGHMPSLYKTPVPETNLLGNTPTIPFTSLPSRDESSKYTIHSSSGIQIGDSNYMEIGGMSSSVLDSTYMNLKEEPASKYQAIFDNTTSLTDKHLDPVRENLGRHWKNCARKLGFSESQIDEIDHDYERDGLKEKVYQMLQKWLMRAGSKGATVGKLAYALYLCSRIDLVNCLIRISQS